MAANGFNSLPLDNLIAQPRDFCVDVKKCFKTGFERLASGKVSFRLET
jgi:hypothetical protein